MTDTLTYVTHDIIFSLLPVNKETFFPPPYHAQVIHTHKSYFSAGWQIIVYTFHTMNLT